MSFDSWTLTLISNLIQASLVKASLGNEKKANSPEADVFLQSFTQQYLMLLYWTVQHNWMELPPYYT